MARKKRRTFTAEFKLEVVLEALKNEKTAAQICRERDITENLLSQWKSQFLERASSVFEPAHQAKYQHQEQERMAELERLAGRQALELEILKKAGAALGLSLTSNGRSSTNGGSNTR